MRNQDFLKSEYLPWKEGCWPKHPGSREDGLSGRAQFLAVIRCRLLKTWSISYSEWPSVGSSLSGHWKLLTKRPYNTVVTRSCTLCDGFFTWRPGKDWFQHRTAKIGALAAANSLYSAAASYFNVLRWAHQIRRVEIPKTSRCFNMLSICRESKWTRRGMTIKDQHALHLPQMLWMDLKVS